MYHSPQSAMGQLRKRCRLLRAWQSPDHVRDKWREPFQRNGFVYTSERNGLDHLPGVVPFRLERFALEPFHTRLHYSKNRSGTVPLRSVNGLLVLGARYNNLALGARYNNLALGARYNLALGAFYNNLALGSCYS